MSSLGVSSSLWQIDEPKYQTKHFRQLLVDASSRIVSSSLAPSCRCLVSFLDTLHGKAITRAQLWLYDPMVYQPACLFCPSCDEIVKNLFFVSARP
ncbi:hypothetical protein BD408DRAFT_427210, partial [Parasitella parasitica]